MALYDMTVVQMKKMLSNLGRWLELAKKHAADKSFDVNVLLTARLAPDQFAFVRQVQSSCDNAKFAAARLTGRDAPRHPDTEQSVDELQARIASTIAYLETFTAKDFEGAEARKVTLPWAEGMYLEGEAYAREMALPNFYFHVTTAYAILRHNGVALGKTDYLGGLEFHPL